MNSSPTPTAVSVAPATQSENVFARRQPLWRRIVGSISAIGLTLCLIAITTIVLFGSLPLLRAGLEGGDGTSDIESAPARAIVSGLAALCGVVLPLILVAVAARKKWLNWKTLSFGWLAVLPILGWLAWDDHAIRQPLSIEELSPAFPGAKISFDVLMRYSKRSALAKEFDQIKWATPPNMMWNTREPAKWRESVAKHRAAIEADWAQLGPLRSWIQELAAFDRIGDLTPPRVDADIIAFRPWRVLSQRTCAVATLQAMDGKGDEAIATILPLLQAGRQLQPSSRTLVRSMIGVVVERMCVETIAMIMDLTSISAASRAKVHATLLEDNPGLAARRLLLIEYAVFAPAVLQNRFGDVQFGRNTWAHRPLRPVMNLLSQLFIHPNATMNLYGERVYALAALAEKRALGEFTVATKHFDDSLRRQAGMRNIGGRLVLNMAVPSYGKVIEAHWTLADLRAALRKRTAS